MRHHPVGFNARRYSRELGEALVQEMGERKYVYYSNLVAPLSQSEHAWRLSVWLSKSCRSDTSRNGIRTQKNHH